MVRNIIGVIVGLVVAFLVVMSIESINYMLFPIPENIDQNNMEQMKAYIQTLPMMAFLVVIIAHFTGALVAAWVASKIADSHQKLLSVGLGLFLLIMGIMTLIQVPHPVWFMLVDIIVYIPGALLGYSLFKKF